MVANGTTPFRDSMMETAAVFVEAANHTAQALVRAAADGLRERTVGGQQSTGSAGYEWVKGLVGKKEWRIPCLDVLIRL